MTLDLILQLLILAALAIFLPLRLARLLPWRLAMVWANLGLSALFLWLIGMAMLAAPYFIAAPDLSHGLRSDPLGAFLWLARLGAMPALLWAPLLFFSEFVIAQRIAQNPGRAGGTR